MHLTLKDQSSFKNLLVLCACEGCIQKDGPFCHQFEVDKVPYRLQRKTKQHFCKEACQKSMVYDIYVQIMDSYSDDRPDNWPLSQNTVGNTDVEALKFLQELLDDPVPQEQAPSLEVP